MDRLESKLDRVLLLLERYFELNPGYAGSKTFDGGGSFLPGSGHVPWFHEREEARRSWEERIAAERLLAAETVQGGA